MSQGDYEIKAYYANRPDQGKRYGQLAMHTWHIGEHSRDMEVDVFLGRDDIAYIEVIDCINHTTTRRYLGDGK